MIAGMAVVCEANCFPPKGMEKAEKDNCAADESAGDFADDVGFKYEVWDDVVDADEFYRGVNFTLTNGVCEIMAPAGKYLGKESSNYESVEQVPWRLESIPEWCFTGDGLEGFLLLAQRLGADGKPATGAMARESTLLLFWRDTTAKVYGGWSCADGHLGMGLVPVRDAAAVAIVNGRLRLRTTWREKPLEYELARSYGGILLGVFDRAASINFGLAYQFKITKNDADLEGKNREFLRIIDTNIACRAVWRSPDAEDEYFAWIEKHRVTRADAYDSVPELADGGGFALSDADAQTLARLYLERNDYEKYYIYDEDSEALMAKWRKAAEPMLLTIRLADSACDERADFSLTRDGKWMVIESGYAMPTIEDQDGFEHRRITTGGRIYRLPAKKRAIVAQILDRLVESAQ